MKAPQIILLVEDSENDRFFMRAAFKKAQYKGLLQEVRNGDEAIAYLKGEGLHSDRNEFPLPDVMLLDLNMPKRNGFDVLAWVRAQPGLKRLAIIILTSSLRHQDLERAFDLGATSFLVKPNDLEMLETMMQCLIDWVQINHFPPLEESGKRQGA